MSAVDHSIARLMAVFAPPESDDPAAFMRELRVALDGLSSDALADGVTAIIKTRKARSFPSIGDVRQACIDTLPRVAPSYHKDVTAALADEEQRELEAIQLLASWPQIDKAIEQGKHGVLYDFVRRNGKLPATTDELRFLGGQFQSVERVAEWAETPPEDGRPSAAWFVANEMRRAVMARRESLARKILNARTENAA